MSTLAVQRKVNKHKKGSWGQRKFPRPKLPYMMYRLITDAQEKSPQEKIFP